MPLYLGRLGRGGSLKTVLCEDLFSPLAPLFDEARNNRLAVHPHP
jgi:hypothetical protein